MKWLLVALLWGAALLNYLDRQVVFSLFPLLERDLHASASELGLISTVFLIAYGLLSPFGGHLADRFGRVRIILVSLLVWSAATWLTGHAGSMSTMLGARMLMGASEAFYLPAALALIADRHGAGTRSLATGLHQSGLYTGMVVGGTWGGWMAERSGWRPVFSILGVIGLSYFVLLLLTLRRDTPRAATANTGGSPLALLRISGFVPVAAAFGAMALSNWLIYTWLPLFLFEKFHMSLGSAGFSATFYIQAASYVGVVVGGIFADRWALRAPNARVYSQMGGMLVAAPFLMLLSVTASQPVLIAALVAFGLGRGVFDCNTMPVLQDITGARLSATGYGVLNLVGCLVGGIGAGVAGFLKENLGLSAAFRAAAVVLVAGGLVMLQVRKMRSSASSALEQSKP